MSNKGKCDCGEKPLPKMKVPASLCPGILSQPAKPHVCHSGSLVKLESTSFIVACVSRTRLLCPAGCYLQLTGAIAQLLPQGCPQWYHRSPPSSSPVRARCTPGSGCSGTSLGPSSPHASCHLQLCSRRRTALQNRKSGHPRTAELQLDRLLMGNGGQPWQSPKEGTRGRHGQSWPSCWSFPQLEGNS